MWGASLEPEAEKNTSVRPAYSSRKRSARKRTASAPGCGQARRQARSSAGNHGSTASSSNGRKYHHGSKRLCTVVRKRVKCSCTKKNCGKLGLRSDTATNHGAATPRNSATPAAGCRRRHGAASRSMNVYSMSAPPASTPTTIPLDSTASAASAQAASIQRRSGTEAGGALCATVNASSAAVSQKVNAPSSRFKCPTTAKNGLTASASSAASALPAP